MNTQKTLFFLAVAATNVLGCSIVCKPECRFGSRITKEDTTFDICKAKGQVIELKIPQAYTFLTSCDGVQVSSEGCSVDRTLNSATATCEDAGECKVQWTKVVQTCICERSGPCDGKCQSVPQCKEGEEISQDDCAIVNGECRVEEKCCVEKHCVPAAKKSCVTECGQKVPHGYSGKGFGRDYCNQCNCVDGSFWCTKMACPSSKVCLSRLDLCKAPDTKYNLAFDRSHECPAGTKCQSLFGEKEWLHCW